MFKIWLEGEEHDKVFRTKAENFFDKFSNWVLDNLDDLGDFPYHLQAQGFQITADQIDPEYTKDFVIIITDVDEIPQAGRTPKGDKHWLIIPLLEPDSYDPAYKTFDAEMNDPDEIEYRLEGPIKDTFIHEFIHYLDFQRLKDSPEQLAKRMKRNVQYSSERDPRYYLNPAEYNAYYQEGVSKFMKEWDSMSDADKESLLSNFDKFKNEIFKSFDNQFILAIIDNKEWLKRITKRIYSLFVHLKQS